MKWVTLCGFLAVGVACEGSPSAPTAGERTIQLAYQNNVGGDIEPCG